MAHSATEMRIAGKIARARSAEQFVINDTGTNDSMLRFVCFVVDDLTADSYIVQETLRLVTPARNSVREDFEGAEILLLSSFPEADARLPRCAAPALLGPPRQNSCCSRSIPTDGWDGCGADIRTLPRHADGETLFLADSDRGILRLRALGLPAAGFRHANNRSEPITASGEVLERTEDMWPSEFCRVYARICRRPWTVLETPRLLIREFEDSEEDFSALMALYQDAQAQRFLSCPSADTAREREIFRAYLRTAYPLWGYGFWALIRKDTGKLIGRAGFSIPPESASPEPDSLKDRSRMSEMHAPRTSGASPSAPTATGPCFPLSDAPVLTYKKAAADKDAAQEGSFASSKDAVQGGSCASVKNAAQGGSFASGVDAPALGYLIAADCRQQGFAGEACRSILRFGFRELGFEEVCAYVHQENTASIRLLEKLEFTQRGTRI